jgi:hypothetical protein
MITQGDDGVYNISICFEGKHANNWSSAPYLEIAQQSWRTTNLTKSKWATLCEEGVLETASRFEMEPGHIFVDEHKLATFCERAANQRVHDVDARSLLRMRLVQWLMM